MNIQDLIYFVSVVDSNSFTKTAQKLNISQPGLSKVFRRLEKELGTNIVEPRAKGVYLTYAGKLLLQHARTIIAEENTVKIEIDKWLNKSTLITIASCEPGPILYLRQIMGNDYFHIDLNLERFSILTAALENLKNDKVDMIITSQTVEDPELECIFYGRDELWLTVGENDKRLEKVEEISLTDERIDEICYLNVKGDFSTKVHQLLPKLCEGKKFYPETEYIALFSLMKSKPFFSFITKLAKSLRPDEHRRSIRLTDEGLDISYYLVYKKKDENRLQIVIDLVKQISNKFP